MLRRYPSSSLPPPRMVDYLAAALVTSAWMAGLRGAAEAGLRSAAEAGLLAVVGAAADMVGAAADMVGVLVGDGCRLADAGDAAMSTVKYLLMSEG